eukprot:5093297-Pleurochrysis_carterae.AAC.1
MRGKCARNRAFVGPQCGRSRVCGRRSERKAEPYGQDVASWRSTPVRSRRDVRGMRAVLRVCSRALVKRLTSSQ